MPGGSLRDVRQKFDADASAYLAEVQKIIRANREVLDSIRQVQKVRIDADISGVLRGVAAAKAELGSLHDKTVTVTVKYVTAGDKPGSGALGLGADHAAMIRELRDISASADMTTASLGRMEDHLAVISRSVQDSSASLDMQTQMLRDNADAHNLVAAAAARSAAAQRDVAIVAGGGGGGGGGGALAGAAAGGFAGRIFGGALPTLQAAHMITMFTMEALSTIIPAAVAAGAAGAVGYQAGQTLYGRGTAMWTAAEALGPAYGGQTLGTMTGLSSNLQRAQDLAQGGVFGIAGGLKDLVGQGSGAFTGMGVQTIAMIDRGIAAMVLHNRMGAVTQALGGGTGFLRSFGDIGANIGDTLLNLAPNLPGIGPDLLGSLKGITGAAAFATGHIPGPLLGAGLAAEAGWRWGGPILGGGKLPGWLGGAKFGGLAGLAERLGLGTVAGAGAEGAGLAGFLGAGAGPLGLAAALSAFAMTQLAGTMPTPAMRQMAGLQGAIGQSFGAGALTPIKALYQAASQGAAGIPATGFAGYVANYMPAMETPSQYARFGPQAGMGPTAAGVYQNAAGSATQVLTDLVTAGPSAVKALAGIGIKGASLTQAFEAMSMAMVGPQDYKGGQLTPRGKQMLQQFAQTYRTAAIGGQPGTASGLLAAGAADYIMSAPAMKSLSQVNQGMDAMTQIMTGGAAGQAALFGMLGGTPVTRTRAGLKLPAGPAYPAMAAALSNIFTPQGAAAWQTFAGPQGLISAQQANLDQMRTYLTLGAISGQQGAQLGAFDLQSMLPLARHSPAALSMLMSMGMQANIPGMQYFQGSATSGKNLAAQYAIAMKAIMGSAGTAAGAQSIINQGTVNTANLPAIAASLITGGMGGPSALESGLTAQMAGQALALAGHPLLKGGGVNMAALQGLTSSLAMGGVKGGQMTVAVDAILKNLHVPAGLVAEINGKLKTPPVPPAKGVVNYDNHLKPVPTQHASGVVSYSNRFAHAAPPVLHGIAIYSVEMAGVAGVPGIRIHGQSGFKVPGYGGGDIFPAMLEGGEAVVPKHLVPAIAPFLSANKVPGFALGGLLPSGNTGQLSLFEHDTANILGDLVKAVNGLAAAQRGSQGGPLPLPAAAQKIIDQFEATFKGMGSPWGKFASELLNGLIDGIKNNKGETAKMAQALVSKVAQEVNFAKSTSASMVQGLNLAGMTGLGTPMTADQQILAGGGTLSVQQQMGDYLASLKSFSGDFGKLAKGGLNKDLLKQILGAGPVQGDALAQSILGGAGGVGSANQLYKQIQQQANQLGIGAAQDIYGPIQHGKNVKVGVQADAGPVHALQAAIDSLHGKTVVIQVQVTTGSGGGGQSNLSPAEIKSVAEQVETKFLQQGRRNLKTGLQLRGKGA